MRRLHGLAALAFAASAAALADIMVPLYVYPGNSTWTNPDWSAAVDAIKDNPDLHFYVIINPNNGPSNTSDPSGLNGGYCNVYNDTNYIPHGCNRDWTTHLAAITKLRNAQTLGYVWTRYGERPAADVKADILEWSRWDTADTWDAAVNNVDISIHGLWFDEVGAAAGNLSFYRDLATYANETFAAAADPDDYSLVLNPGPVPDAAYEADLFGIASAVVTKETCYTTDAASLGVAWDCPTPYAAFDYAALERGNGLPHDAALLPQTVVIVHQFRGPPTADEATLQAQIDGVVGLGVHSTYFTSGSWHNTTIEPATIGTVSRLVAEAKSSSAAPLRQAALLPWACALLLLLRVS